MRLQDILNTLENIAPPGAAESWDNVGLLVGDQNQSIHRIFLTVDYTPATADEARELNCDLVIAYHPPLFSAVKRVTAEEATSLIHDAIRRGVAIYSPHTAWDVAEGGTNDLLADAVGLSERTPLRAIVPQANALKFITFVPETHLQTVSDAMFAAGAGIIGDYTHCSFRTTGTGTFKGGKTSRPAIGEPGRLETVPEIKLEMVIPAGKVDAVVAALRKSHPYETPAFDLTVLAATPTGTGQGRVGDLPVKTGLVELIERLKKELALSHLLVVGDVNRAVQRVAVCAGSGGDLLDDAIARVADLFLTGELRHHDALKALRSGVACICTLHSNSERPSLMRLKSRLEQAALLPEVLVSQMDRDPFAVC